MSFFEELKRRNVFRVGIAYGVASWLLLQLSDILAPLLNLPETAQRFVLFGLVIGFIPALIFAWAYEMTPEGLKKEKDVDRSQSIAPQTGRKLDRTIIAVLALAVVFLLYQQLGEKGPDSSSETSTGQTPHVEVAQNAVTPQPRVTGKSVAVLPFVNMSSDPEQEYFSDGLSEELLNRLAKNDQLHVAARTSAFQFKGQNLDIADIGRQLKVAHILEGSVRKSGNKLRITAQLIQVDNGFHLWSETYERELDDVFTIQDDISKAISRALAIELGTTSSAPGNTQPTTNLEAYNHYLQARFLLAQRGDENMRKADELFNKAVTLDPAFSEAWSGLAFNSALLYSYSPTVSLEESHEKTMNAAHHAIELDPRNAEAYTAIGRTLSNTWDWKGSQASFERAYELGPKDVGVLNLYGDFLWNAGDYDRAIAMKQQAINLDPLSGVLAGDLAEILGEAGHFDEALASAERGVMLAPGSFQRFNSLVWALLAKTDYEQAWRVIEKTEQSLLGQTDLWVFPPRWKAMLHYRQNETEQLRWIVDEQIRYLRKGRADRRGLGPAYIGFFLLSLDGVKTALPWLEQAYLEKDYDLMQSGLFYLPELISQDPEWLAFWDKPELKELHEMRRAGLPNPHGLWHLSPLPEEASQ